MKKQILIFGILFVLVSLIVAQPTAANSGNQGPEKIVICLLLPAANLPGQTIMVAETAAQRLFNLGAYSGACSRY